MSNTAKMSANDRILALLDENSFVEIGGQIAARNTDFNVQQKKVPADGVITGYGTIQGNLVYVYSQDTKGFAGAIGEMHAKKITNLYDMACKMGAPVIGLIDSAGVRLQEATDALDALGKIYTRQSMASGVIPMICAIFGGCGGGLSLVPALSDFIYMEKDNGKLFVNAPSTIPGNKKETCDNTTAEFQAKEAGNVDFTGTEAEILEQIRMLVSILPANNEDNLSYEECSDDLNRTCPDLENAAADPAIAFAQISDNHFFFEIKKEYAKDMVTGFIRLNGVTIGAIANRTIQYDEEGKEAEVFEPVLSVNGCKKAAEFVEFCDAFNLPVLTFTNVKGFKACLCGEKQMPKAAAKLVYAFTNATVPKVNVVTKEAFGSAYLVMNSKSIGSDIVYAWPNAKIGMMPADQAVRIMYAEELKEAEHTMETLEEKKQEYENLQSSIESAAARGYVDTIIAPADTRKYLIGSFEMLFTKREERPLRKHGTV